MYRFLLTRRWLGLLAAAVAVAVACVLLGTWQWQRREARLERNALVEQNYDLEPVALRAVVQDGAVPTERTWTPVRLTGRYVEKGTVLVRNRSYQGRPGYRVLVPLLGDGGTTLLVDRGWVPTGATGAAPDSVPSPPAGPVTVVARLLPAEPVSERDAPAGQTQRIAPGALAEEVERSTGGVVPAPSVLAGSYGVLGQETPPAAEPLRLLPRPELDEGPHLSYAMQWVVFALTALVGFVVLARRTAEWDADDAAAAAAAGGSGQDAPPARPSAAVSNRTSGRIRSAPTRRSGRRPTAEEEEDALLDAAAAAAVSRPDPVEARRAASRAAENPH